MSDESLIVQTLTHIQATLALSGERLARIETSTIEIDRKVTAINGRVGRVEQRVDSLESTRDRQMGVLTALVILGGAIGGFASKIVEVMIPK